MLNKKTNPKNNSWKITLIFPVLLAFMLIFSCSNTSENTEVPSEKNSVFIEGKPAISFNKENPLIIVNGDIKENNFNINSISPVDIAKVDVLKGKAATEKYGEKGEKGVIEITLKNGAETNDQSESPNGFKSAKEKSANKHSHPELTEPLFVIDGKIMPEDFKVNSINQEEIEYVNVLKGETATEKYGKEGGKGAIEITLKTD